MKIESINKNWLIKLQVLFSKSFGENISIQDEVEYFEKEKPKNWFVAINNKDLPIGFIRYFPINNRKLFVAELYANDLINQKKLIEKFDNNIKKLSIQFRIKKTEQKLINYLKTMGYDQKIEEFKEYVYSKQLIGNENKSIRFGRKTKKEISKIVEILKELRHHSKSEIAKLIDENRIVIYKKNDKIIGTSVNNINNKSIEIVEIAIKNKFRRKGFGKELLEETMCLYSNKYPKKTFKLKIEKENIAAIKLYEKVGFRENKENCELWLTKK